MLKQRKIQWVEKEESYYKILSVFINIIYWCYNEINEIVYIKLMLLRGNNVKV